MTMPSTRSLRSNAVLRRTGRAEKQARLVNLALSAIVGVLIWTYVNNRNIVTIEDMRIPISFILKEDTEKDWLIDPDIPKEVSVSFSGAASDIAELRSKDITFRIPIVPPDDNREMTMQIVETFLRSELLFGVSPKVTIDKIAPQQLMVKLWRLEMQTIPLEAEIIGSPSEGVKISDIQITPVAIPMLLPKGIVTPEDRVKIHPPISVSGKNRTFVAYGEPLPLVKGDRTFRNMTYTNVAVTVELSTPLKQQKFSNVPVGMVWRQGPGIPPTVGTLQPEAVELIIEGVEQRMDYSVADVTVIADIQQAELPEPGVYAMPLRALSPDGTRIVKITPDQVRWTPGANAYSAAPLFSAPQSESTQSGNN